MRNLLILALCFFTCAIISASDELDTGPGIFSGEKGEFVLFGKNNKKNKFEEITTAPEPTNHAQNEFELFKEWKQGRELQTDDYKEFLLWLEYKEFKQ